MKGTKLFLQLKSLSKEELKLLRKAIQSPYFNTNPSVELLFDKLRRQHPNFDDTPRGKRRLYERMFPNETYNDGKLRRLFTFLSQVVEKFLLCEELEKDKRKGQLMLNKIYEKRNVRLLFEQTLERLLEEQDQTTIKSTDWYHDQFQLLITRYSSLNHTKYDLKDDTLDKAVQYLDSYFALQKLQMAIGQKNREKILNQKPNYGFLKLPSGEDIPNNQLFQLYFQSHNLLTEDLEVDFDNYEKLLFELHESLSINDKLMLFYNGLNYLVRLANKGDGTNTQTILKWYKWGLKEKIFTAKGQISSITFSNIVFHACLKEDFDWVTAFITQYAPFLNKNLRADEIAYSKSVMLFYKKDFHAVIFKLSNYEFSNRYVLKTKNLIVRTYFELFLENTAFFDVLENTIKSYENYLYRNVSFNAKLLQPHLNFIQILKGITVKIQCKTPSFELLEWTKEQIERRESIISKSWLVSKIWADKKQAELGISN